VNRDPSARYRYRYEEVEAIRRTGMKVVATVDLHDVASVAPRVLAETGVERDSRVPDWVLKEATELEVVDVTPATLLERLSQLEGGIAEERAARLRHVYTLDVLGRLRELALRLVASHTDARLTAYMDMTGITEPWESMLRVMACVAPVPGLEPLIERAGRETERVEGTLVVVSVAPADTKKERPAEDEILDRYRTLTEQAGGQFVALRSNQPAQALLDYAKRTHVTQLVLARGDSSHGTFDSSIKREIIKGASQIDVHVLREFAPAQPPLGAVHITEEDAGI
jgi:two-component system sensor histidine kinase KdpD